MPFYPGGMRRPVFIAQHGRRPHGILGRLIAGIMACETAGDNDRAIAFLELAATDRVLDVGAGHGRTLTKIAAHTTRGCATGLDDSDVMVAMARRRNKRQIKKGRVEVRAGRSDAMPFADQSFDKALSVHTIYFWTPAGPHLVEIARVLKPGGRFVLGFRPSDDHDLSRQFPAEIYHFRTTQEVRELVTVAGFSVEKIERAAGAAAPMAWLVATRQRT